MQRWIGIALIIAALTGMVLTILPVPLKTTTFESKDPLWSFKIEQPEYLRAGDSATLTVDVAPPATQVDGGLNTVSATVRVDFPGLFQGANEVTQIIDQGKSARFPWTLGPAQPGLYEGRIWIYNGLDKFLLNVRTIQVEVRGPEARLQLALRIVVLILAAAGVYLAFFYRSARKN